MSDREQLLEQLARVYARAAVDRWLAEEDKKAGSGKLTGPSLERESINTQDDSSVSTEGPFTVAQSAASIARGANG